MTCSLVLYIQAAVFVETKVACSGLKGYLDAGFAVAAVIYRFTDSAPSRLNTHWGRARDRRGRMEH
jgi:hypothetical protein